MPAARHMNHMAGMTESDSSGNVTNDVPGDAAFLICEQQESVAASTSCPDTRIPTVVQRAENDDAAPEDISQADALSEPQR